MRQPYTLYREKTAAGPVWYARFWDETAGKYSRARSLGVPVEGKRERQREAQNKADEMTASLRSEMLPAPGGFLSISDMPLFQYIEDFWSAGSDYVRQKISVKKRPLAESYIRNSHNSVKNHLRPFPGLEGVTVGRLTRAMVEAWMLWAAENGRSGKVINATLQAMRVPVRIAYKKEYIPKDPFLNIEKATHIEKLRGILSVQEALALIRSPVNDPYTRLAVLLAMLCGLRAGEVRGLQWGDIADGLIDVRHNYQDRAHL
jgi:hypothetical protein